MKRVTEKDILCLKAEAGLTPIRLATDSDRMAAQNHGPISFHTINPSGLIAMQEMLSHLGYDVDEISLGTALDRYFETVES